MAKTAQETDNASIVPMSDDVQRVMQKYGITQQDAYVPPAPTVYKSNVRDLCKLTTAIVDNEGQAIKKVKGHTGPLMFLEKKDEVTPKESKYSGYDGFYIYAILHPMHGETVITVGRPEGEKHLPVVDFLESCKPGAWFQVAEIETNSGYGTYIIVPVQRNGQLVSQVAS